jgi:peptidoglycan/xylan/chitin deacetylase (PgdA/CDA1 family)
MASWAGPDVAVGSHGMTHEPLTTCDDASLNHELRHSRETIQERLGVRVEALAYPNGDFSQKVIDEAMRCGYSLAFTTSPRHMRVGEAPYSVPRVLVGREDQLPVFASRLSGWIEWVRSG